MSKEVVHITDEQLSDANRTVLVREWWYTYFQVLNRSWTLDKLDVVTDRVIHYGIVKLGQGMSRSGAEDLAKKCYEHKSSGQSIYKCPNSA